MDRKTLAIAACIAVGALLYLLVAGKIG